MLILTSSCNLLVGLFGDGEEDSDDYLAPKATTPTPLPAPVVLTGPKPTPYTNYTESFFYDACYTSTNWAPAASGTALSVMNDGISEKLKVQSQNWGMIVPGVTPPPDPWYNYRLECSYDISAGALRDCHVIAAHALLKKRGSGDTILDYEGWNVEFNYSPPSLMVTYYTGDGTENSAVHELWLEAGSIPPSGTFQLLCIDYELWVTIDGILCAYANIPDSYDCTGTIGLGAFGCVDPEYVLFDNINVVGISTGGQLEP